jgi:hypothetical protein
MEPFQTEVTLPVEVEVIAATVGHPGRYQARPEDCVPDELEDVEIVVWLVGPDGARLELTPGLPAAVRDALAADALERLRDAAVTALLP